MADLEYLKAVKKQKKLTLQYIADVSGIPKRTVDDIFSGHTKHPRVDTMQAIERALGITNERADVPAYTEDEKKFLALVSELTDEETQELSNYIDFIKSKRK